jgi:DNA-binding transcriptional LysR family regulator
VRIGNLADSSLVARKIAPVRRVVLASSDYLARRGRPQHPRDLDGHDIVVYANAGQAEQWRFRVAGRWEQPRGRARFRADNGELIRAAASEGLGICILPTFIASSAIASGELETILSGYPLNDVGLHVVMPPGRAITARVRALVDFLAARFGPEPSWDPCSAARDC